MTLRPDPTFHATAQLAMQAPVETYGFTVMLSPCVFHGYVAIESMNMWPRIPRACGHRFHGMWPPL